MDETIKTLVGKTLVDVRLNDDKDELFFDVDNGEEYMLYHSQDCCEHVRLEEIVGDIKDLVGSAITEAEESTNSEDNRPYDYSHSWTWTFYKLRTAKGVVTLRWLGESNGYYSEAVDFRRVK